MGRPPKTGASLFRFSPTEVAEMESLLKKHNNQMPAALVLQGIADMFNQKPERSRTVQVQMKQVRNWFQNRKSAIARTKAAGTESGTSRVDCALEASQDTGETDAETQEAACILEAIRATRTSEGISQGVKDTDGCMVIELGGEAPAAQVHSSALVEYHSGEGASFADLRSPVGLPGEDHDAHEGVALGGRIIWSSAASSQTKLVPASAPLPFGYEDHEGKVDAGRDGVPPLRDIIRGVGLSEDHVRVLARIRLGRRETFKDILRVPTLHRLSILTLLCTTLVGLDQKSPPTISLEDAEYLHGGLEALRDSPLQVEWLVKRVEDIYNQVSLAAVQRQIISLKGEREELYTRLAHVDKMEAALRAEMNDRASRPPGVTLREDDSLSAGLM